MYNIEFEVATSLVGALVNRVQPDDNYYIYIRNSSLN